MRRFFGSLLVAMIIGIAAGVYLGWVQFPAESEDSALCQLSPEYREKYTLMVARSYQGMLAQNVPPNEGRVVALNRLLPLNATNAEACLQNPDNQIDNIPAWVQEVTERYLSRGEDLRDVCHLAALSAAFGRQIPNYADRPGTLCDQYDVPS